MGSADMGSAEEADGRGGGGRGRGGGGRGRGRPPAAARAHAPPEAADPKNGAGSKKDKMNDARISAAEAEKLKQQVANMKDANARLTKGESSGR